MTRMLLVVRQLVGSGNSHENLVLALCIAVSFNSNSLGEFITQWREFVVQVACGCESSK